MPTVPHIARAPEPNPKPAATKPAIVRSREGGSAGLDDLPAAERARLLLARLADPAAWVR